MIISIILIVVIITVGFLMKKEFDKERNQLSVKSIDLCDHRINIPLKIVFLSDLHDKKFGEKNRRLIKTIEDIRPDCILIGGDTMNVRKRKIELRVTEDLFAGLSQIVPVYYENGNNERRLTWEAENFGKYKSEFLQLLDKYDIHYMNNLNTDVGENVRITGLNLDLCHYKEFIYKKLTRKFINNAVGKSDPCKYNILLCHSPMFIETYADWNTDLILTGHSHGEIIKFPMDRKKQPRVIDNDIGIIFGQYQLLHKYFADVFWKRKTCMIVSKKLGTHTVNVRINNLTQIVVVNLICQE